MPLKLDGCAVDADAAVTMDADGYAVLLDAAAVRLASGAVLQPFATEEGGLRVSSSGIAPPQLPRSAVQTVSKVGSGNFGEIWLATLDRGGMGLKEKVAVKVARKKRAIDELLDEAMLMAQITPHPNVVGLVGVVAEGGEMMLVLPFCAHGSLIGMMSRWCDPDSQSPLADARADDRIQVARQVCAGMAHLHAARVVHRDLAARNVLVGADGADFVYRVADFGLGRKAKRASTAADGASPSDAADDYYYRSAAGVFPVRWTAPEVMLSLVFSAANDVWAFGITMIEVYLPPGAVPYGAMLNEQVRSAVIGGERPERPLRCPPRVYSTLQRCWASDPAARPTFAALEAEFFGLSRADLGPAVHVGQVSAVDEGSGSMPLDWPSDGCTEEDTGGKGAGGTVMSVKGTKISGAANTVNAARCPKCRAKVQWCTCSEPASPLRRHQKPPVSALVETAI